MRKNTRKYFETALIGLFTIPIVYLAMVNGLRGEFFLSTPNAKFAVSLGAILGIVIFFILNNFLASSSKKRIIVGIVLEIISYVGVFLWVAAMASV